MTESLTTLFGHKVKTPEEVKAIIGPRPREKKVVMCHGTFDVVHPGHLRHLIYAKGKADILIASLTADKHIDKGKDRPHVPQQLRAVNLAAFQMVDYVVIDENATPLKNLALIQPDYFVKGYEYNAQGLHPKTREEMDIVSGYGGEVIFSPGDIVYSSSKLINLAPPDIKYDKLLTLMESEGVTMQKMEDTLRKMAGFTVHVVGDTIIDSLTRCTMIGGQTKTPTMSVLFEEKVDFVGGAGVVSEHLSAAGAKVVFTTVLGNDAYKDFAIQQLEKGGIVVRPAIDHTRPTTNKNAIVAGGYRLLKVDTLDNQSVSGKILEAMLESVRTVPADAVIFSDFRHGVFSRRTIPLFTEAIPPNTYRVADSQVASRWGNITDFKGFDLITPNEREARFALGDQDSGIRPLAHDLYMQSGCKTLIMKMGERGAITYRDKDETLNSYFVVDSFVDQIVDPVGAGDALLAYATLAMLVSQSPAIATILGSIAAACECEVDGNIPVTPEHVAAKLAHIKKRLRFDS